MSIKIYLSPSGQAANKYAVGSTNEKIQMEKLAAKIKEILENEYDCTSFIATSSLGIGINERSKEAKDLGADVYLALHSNAGGAGKASGAVAFYHPKSAKSRELAKNITNELGAICPIKSNRSSPVQNGMLKFASRGLGEIRSPFSRGLIPVLAETDFHDNPATALWIINNQDIIARAYVRAIVKTFGINTIYIEGNTQKDKLYKVQVGAFKEKGNAIALVDKLKKAGFESFIKVE